MAFNSASVTTQAGESNEGSSSNEGTVQLSPTSPAIYRQIIYDAEISVEVSDIDRLTEQLNFRLRELQGFVSNFNEQRFEGDRRTATWTVRIDATKFLDFLKWLDYETRSIHRSETCG